MAAGEKDAIRAFATKKAWAKWLDANHAKATGIWIKLPKQGVDLASVSRKEALDLALCYGWIDATARRVDDEYWVQRFTPRRPRSTWSKINCTRVEELIAAGEMQPSGLREIERAKADGRWEAAYSGPRAVTVPDDLQRALAKHKGARDFFASLDSRNRYAILHRLEIAGKPETRARRLEKFVEMLRKKERIYP
jgi:uncharacterized protein YdeI (YjbR/CyaY-like superfamily)